MNYDETMEYINSRGRFGSNLGLSRTLKILEHLGNPQNNLKLVHVAGTNGKGSTTALISQILLEAGNKVGMYTSPFLMDFEERIQINNSNISKEDISEVVTKVKEAAEMVSLEDHSESTEFEIITCAAFLYFYLKKVDFAVIEVGLGGRLDSTNVITPMVSVITSISLDHMEILGKTLKEIAFEKAGIIKNSVPVVSYPQEREAEKVIEETAKERNADLYKVSDANTHLLGCSPMQHFYLKTDKEKYDIHLSLLGRYQILNSIVAVKTIEILQTLGVNVTKSNIETALSKTKWMGRLEIVKHDPMVVLDGAHNIDGMRNIRDSLKLYFNYNKLYLIVGILKDKQVEEMINTIVPEAVHVLTVTPNSKRALSAEELKSIVLKHTEECEAFEDYKEAYERALSLAENDDLIFICGSLYMIGDMRRIIINSK